MKICFISNSRIKNNTMENKEKNLNEKINDIPNIDTKMKYLIDTADHLFRDVKLRMSYVKSAGDETKMLLRIYFNDSLCLWFYEKDGNLKYDGWEMGNYQSRNLTNPSE